MSKQNKLRLPALSNQDRVKCTATYALYLMACNASTVNLAKKLIAKHNVPLFSSAEILKDIPQRYHLFINQMRPAVFENFLIVARAAKGSNDQVDIGAELLKHLKNLSRECHCEETLVRNTDLIQVIQKHNDILTPESMIRYSLVLMAQGKYETAEARDDLLDNIAGLSYYMSVPLYGLTNFDEKVKNHTFFPKLSKSWRPAAEDICSKGIYHISVLDDCTEFADAIENTLTRHKINMSDFYREQLIRKEKEGAVRDVLVALTCNLGILNKLDESVAAYVKSEKGNESGLDEISVMLEQFNKDIGNSIPLLLYSIALETLAKMYSSARDTANKLAKEVLDTSVVYQKEQQRNVIQEHKLAKAEAKQKDQSLAAEKQKQLNLLQSRYETLQQKYDDALQENQFLRRLLEDAEHPEETDTGEEIELSIEIPEDCILFGGHPNWQRKFHLQHPNIKIMSGTDPTFDETVLRSYDVVLLNSHHMKHSLFYKIRRNQQRLGFRIIYID
ncbi:MAG: hypothetical protein K6F95_06585 [Selenomonas sp.]|uniref:hypothetical protein n=1 Tax=Selenomonas sp. TaxID=2053611 RepID=UPI0025E9D0CF|nr:hypothetical protein [Selenomonas sp.]MCR5757556.1 hypothetical protein [Selenomonas sp.]